MQRSNQLSNNDIQNRSVVWKCGMALLSLVSMEWGETGKKMYFWSHVMQYVFYLGI